MNQKNFEFLRDQVKFTGFGDNLESQLKANLASDKPEFRLQHQTSFGDRQIEASLHFKKSAQSDMYFFNSYKAELPKKDNKEALTQNFYINREGGNITLKEAFNLLEGRAVNKDLVNKEGQLYNAWQQLDFKQTTQQGNFAVKQFSQNYGFDLEKSLSKHPIAELSDPISRERLIESLQKGNRQMVTFNENGSSQKRFIEASPQFKSLNIYDEKQQRIRPTQIQSENGEKQSEKVDQKKQMKEGESEKAERPSRRKGVSV